MKFMRIALAAAFAVTCVAQTGGFGTFAGIIRDRIEAETAETEPECEDITPKRGRRTPMGQENGKNRHRSEKASRTFVREEAVACVSDGMSWYCPHETDGKRPSVPSEMVWLTEHGGHFLGEDERVIYLTFDAGYENGNVEKILDVLKAENVPGAFFILENLVTRNPELVNRMREEGHLVCNHTAKHPDMTQKTQEEFEAELRAMEDAYRDLTGEEIAKYYRPPEGRFSRENLDWARGMGYETILWSYAYADWDNNRQPDPVSSIQKVISGTHNGEVILLHPTSATNAEILPELIRQWKEMGYRFGTLDELCGKL
ncbi:MAG: polysaccharide deacetylase family protein [Clostridiales bacterium]|nr:polysaccharide deacetylase family protein [Clostridiales bacterium]